MKSFGRDKSAEAALAGAEIRNCGAQMLGAEVRPHGVGEEQFGVGALPQQEVREPLFAAGADQQVDVAAGAVALEREQVSECAAPGRVVAEPGRGGMIFTREERQ